MSDKPTVLSPAQRAYAIKVFYQTLSANHVRACCQALFGIAPTPKQISLWTTSFEETGFIERPKKHEEDEFMAVYICETPKKNESTTNISAPKKKMDFERKFKDTQSSPMDTPKKQKLDMM